MKKPPFCLTLLSALLFAASAAHADNLTVEAETNPTAGDLKILDDPLASGGKAVSMPRDWQPLFKGAVPKGESFTVWVRYKGGAILAKKTSGGKQSDLKWSYEKPAQFTWKKLGRYTRDELGEDLIIIRGGGAGRGRWSMRSCSAARKISRRRLQSFQPEVLPPLKPRPNSTPAIPTSTKARRSRWA